VQDLCPYCGTKRIGAFRYCRACRFDFDALGANAGAWAGSHPTASSDVELLALAGIRRSPVRGLLALAFVVVVGVAGLSMGIGPATGSRSAAVSTTFATGRAEQPFAAAPIAIPSDPPSAAAPLAAGPIGKATRAQVVRVIDGATILVAFGGKRHSVRYLGVDTPPEVGRRASAANAALVVGKTVILEADVSGTDSSGHLLRYVWLQRGSKWTLINAELVRRGFATIAAHSPDKRYADRFDAAEREARARHLGVWGPAPAPRATPDATRRPTTKPSKG
jgi:micrococcal nuclease